MKPLLSKIFPGARISEELAQKFADAEKLDPAGRIDRSDLQRELLEAWVDCALKLGRSSFPFTIALDKEKAIEAQVAQEIAVREIQEKYGFKKSGAAQPPHKSSRSGAA